MGARTDPRIDAYIAKAAPFAQPILRHLRKLVHQGCPEVVETMKWSFPNYVLNGKILCSMAAFKAHCSFGFWHQQMARIAARDGHKPDEAMGVLGRLTSREDLPDDRTLLRYLRTAVELQTSGAPARPRPVAKPRKEPPVPADLAAALKKNKAAATTFAEFSPSHRREYIEWITEAKRDETRQKRLATTIEWLAEGKARNWKYENC